MPMVSCPDGRTYAFEPVSTALIVIDFQRDFVDPEGGCAHGSGESERLAAVMPKVKPVVHAARAAGIEIIHTRESYAPDLSDVSPAKAAMGYVGRPGPLGRNLIRGEPGCGFAPGMEPAPGEMIVDKAGFSAFFETGLDARLREGGIRNLVITGITYNCCVHSTNRDAVERGYACLILDDCCAAGSNELEDAVRALIRSEDNLFGWIADSSAFLDALT